MRDDDIGEALDHLAIDRLQRAYADVVDRRAWADLDRLFTPDAVVDLDLVTRDSLRLEGPTAVGEFIGSAIEEFSFFEFVILNSHIQLAVDGDPDQATARVFMCELRLRSGEAERSEAFGLYRDHYRRTPDGWRIAHRRYRSMARFPAAEVFALPPEL